MNRRDNQTPHEPLRTTVFGGIKTESTANCGLDRHRRPTRLRSGLIGFGSWILLLGFGVSATADSGLCGMSPEGFSESVEGLPEPIRAVWRATVLIEGAALVNPKDETPTIRTNRGSGLIIRGVDRRGVALVVTNAHVIRCGDVPCRLRLGLSRSGDWNTHVWTTVVRVVSEGQKRDLAILEVVVPEEAAVEAPDFVTTGCIDSEAPTVIAIGWPDLRFRVEWGVDPPGNHEDHVKRFSTGLYLSALDGYRPVSKKRGRLKRMGVVFHNADVLPGSSGGPLVNSAGEVLGINTHVVGNTENTHRRYCARRDAHDMDGGCVHLAISSSEIADFYARVFHERLDVAQCSPPRTDSNDSRVASAKPEATDRVTGGLTAER
jgi:S1-C subfamily serine protease